MRISQSIHHPHAKQHRPAAIAGTRNKWRQSRTDYFSDFIHNFLSDRAFAPAAECYAGSDSNS
jgi:hypothetical protein